MHVDLFIPHWLLENLPCYVYGVYRTKENRYQVSCLGLYQDANSENDDLEKINELSPIENLSLFIGAIGSLPKKPCHDKFTFHIDSDIEGKLTVSSIKFPDTQLTNPSTTIILYEHQEMCDKELLQTDDNTFMDFLNESFRCSPQKQLIEKRHNDHKLSLLLLFILQCTFYPFHKAYRSITLPRKVAKLVNISATGRLVGSNLQKYSRIYEMIKDRKISLLCGNLLLALAFDISSGLCLTWAFQEYLQAEEIIEITVDKTDMVVNSLQDLLHWLMGVPAGLKLNRPLNTVCGRFFLYHIYLWKTYIVVLRPYLPVAFNLLLHFWIFGTTFLLSLISDFVSLATIHVYFFYSYAARLYNFKVSSCICLWRLFRGKKWNPLRNRVDSYHYDVQQLFIGTLIFTIVIFLLPTVVVYYFVFTLLRLVMLMFTTAMAKITNTVAILPIYVTVLQLFKHNSINGDLFFQVISNSEKTLTVSMKGVPVTWSQLFSRTLPKNIKATNLTLGMLMRCLIRGIIIHPL